MHKGALFRKLFIMLVAAAILVSPVTLPGLALATEGGGGAYQNGAEDFMAETLPLPGAYFKNYLPTTQPQSSRTTMATISYLILS